jgi:hypothetical protein
MFEEIAAWNYSMYIQLLECQQGMGGGGQKQLNKEEENRLVFLI